MTNNTCKENLYLQGHFFPCRLLMLGPYFFFVCFDSCSLENCYCFNRQQTSEEEDRGRRKEAFSDEQPTCRLIPKAFSLHLRQDQKKTLLRLWVLCFLCVFFKCAFVLSMGGNYPKKGNDPRDVNGPPLLLSEVSESRAHHLQRDFTWSSAGRLEAASLHRGLTTGKMHSCTFCLHLLGNESDQ